MFSKRIKISSDTVKDNDLGMISFANYGDVGEYRCRLRLAISSKKVDVFFSTDAKEDLPTDQQKDFLKSIVDNYDTLIDKSILLISNSADHSYLKGKSIAKFELHPVSLIVPQIDKGKFNWDMTFEVRSVKDVFVIVYFDKFAPLSSTIEQDERKPLTKFLLRLLNGNV